MNSRLVAGVLVVFFLLPMVLAGVALGGVGGFLWLETDEAVESHEPTDATVLSSQIDVDDEPGENPTYRPAITYEYTVDGETYRSSNVMPGPGQTSRADRGWAEDVVANHSEGETVTAYYDPENPSNAFLVRDQGGLVPLALLGFGALSLVGGVLGLVAVVVWVVRS